MVASGLVLYRQAAEIRGKKFFVMGNEQSLTAPRHVAIIMDGNGRWAKARMLPRTAGHKQGVSSARKAIQYCSEKGVEALTLFAFSSENWKRPETEVSTLMELFISALKREARQLAENNIRLKVIGDVSAFSEKLRQTIKETEDMTAASTGLKLQVAANYGGRADIIQAARQLASRVADGQLAVEEIDEALFGQQLYTESLPDPDLFIRTGGETRISNFLLWQLAYTELYFTDVLWPAFDHKDLDAAFAAFGHRERRFGKTGEQVKQHA